MDLSGLWIGLAMFLVPMAWFGWSVYSERGRAGYERMVEEQRRLDKGLPPSPPRSALGRWAVAHPVGIVVLGGMAVGAFTYALGVVAFGATTGEATIRAVIVGAEAAVLAALHVVRDRRRRGS